jgi:hypothetical protein
LLQAKKGRLSGRKHRRKSSPAPSPPAVSQPPSPPPPNPALRLDSNIEGFEDWNLGHVRDFISCMDRARSGAYHRRHSSSASMSILDNLCTQCVYLLFKMENCWRSEFFCFIKKAFIVCQDFN